MKTPLALLPWHYGAMNPSGRKASPKPAQVKALRLAVQTHYKLGIMAAREKMADAVHANPRSWAQWEQGVRVMHPSMWTLAQLRCNAHPHWRLVSRE